MTNELKDKLWPLRRKLALEHNNYSDAVLGNDTEKMLKSAIRMSKIWKEMVDELQVEQALEKTNGFINNSC